MFRPCRCDRFRRGQPYVKGRDCLLCWLFHDPGPKGKKCREQWAKVPTDHPAVVATPISSSGGSRGSKPRLSIEDLAAKRGRCAEKKRQGLPCDEFKKEDAVRKIEWAVGVTTVPSRRDTLLRTTWNSLAMAGFSGARLFADGAENRSGWEAFSQATFRWPAVGVVANFTLGLAELYYRYPLATHYLMVQDDVVFVKNLRPYLERCLLDSSIFQPDSDGVVSKRYMNLISFPVNEAIPPEARTWPGLRWHESAMLSDNHPLRWQVGKGAQALVFPRAGVQALLTSGQFIRKPTSAVRPTTCLDGCIVNCMNELGWRELVHSPSLCQHVGCGKSTLKDSKQLTSGTFPGEEFDALSFLESNVSNPTV